MRSPFDAALAQVDKTIERTMMSTYAIAGIKYQAVYDESPKELDAMSGVLRTLTLYQSQGYVPRKNDTVEIGENEYIVTGFTFNDGLIVLQLEEDGRY